MLLDNRKNLILNTLLENDGYLTGKDLSLVTGVTPRTVQSDIKILMNSLRPRNMEIFSSPRLGYRITEEQKKCIARWLMNQEEPQPISPEERMFYILRHLLNGPVEITRLLSRIHISESTWDKDIKKCSSWLTAQHLTLQRKKNLLKVSGDEASVRNAFIRFYRDQADYSGKETLLVVSAEYPDLAKVRTAVSAFIETVSLQLTDEEYTNFLIYILVSLARERNHDLLSEDTPAEKERVYAKTLIQFLAAQKILLKEENALYIMRQWTTVFSGNLEYLHYKKSLRKILVTLLKEYYDTLPDDDLVESLAKNSFPLVQNRRINFDNPISLQELEKQYPAAVEMTITFMEELRSMYSIEDDSTLVPGIGLCFAAYIERVFRTRERIRVCLICSTGLAGSQLLAAKIKRLYPHVELLGIYPKHRLREAEEENPDLIISTVELTTTTEVLVIENILDDSAFIRITPFFRNNNLGKMLFLGMLSEELFYPDLVCEDPEEVIRFLAARIPFSKDLDADFADRVLARERLGPTSIGNLVAIPHAIPGSGRGNSVCVGILRKPIPWGKEKVQVVFLLKLDNPRTEFAALFSYIYTILSDRTFIKKLIQCKEYSLLIER